MVLRLYNTRTRKKAPFAPLTPGIVKMYVCGPTTYDYSHLGHARSYIDFDTARRYLEFLGHRVTYVQNFTDIEEVIIRRAKEAGQAPLAYAQYYIDSFLDDMRALNVRRADHMPKVSEHIPEITDLIARLVDRGYAYSVDGEVYFRTRKAKHSFGILSHQKFEDIVVEGPAATSPKEDPLDFALWKRSKGDEPSWPSPWGDGRPGWHVECNAMAYKYLGAPLDIHGGGVDLKFPHHESEAMICEGAWGGEWARTWMHNGFVTLEREKMSKSLGNFVTIREVLRDYPGEVVRLCLLKAPYREDVEYDAECFARTRKEYDAMRAAIESARTATGPGTAGKVAALVERTRDGFFRAMNDDINTRDAIYRLQQLTEAVAEVRGMSGAEGRAVVDVYRECGEILGLFPTLHSRLNRRRLGRGGRRTAEVLCESPAWTHLSPRESMAEFKAVIADPKTGKAYKKDITGHYANALIGKKIGEDLDGLYVGLPGYKLQITGGSDKDGFPMRTDLPGPRRKRLLLSSGVGFHPVRPGMRKKKTVRGNTVSPDILQLNLKIVVRGPKSIEDAWQEQAR